MLEDTAEAPLRCSSISLEDGADEALLNGEPVGFCDGGICFPSRWQFHPGTILALTLEISGTGERARAEGIVAWCEQVDERLWSVMVLFLEPPADMAKIRNSNRKLHRDPLRAFSR